ncbi:phthiocerol/phthiodiolone dimycocerosyl transferase family protein [Nocardia tengchongensis]|uniref:phthiocerol/phthiodiolone dimycocerosyl transferase family protein n=1 Tax=Nocardia tengchongensis TaxID=2055889 RepID=UPI00364F2591
MTATTIRPLALSELPFARDCVYIGYAVRARGALDLAAMATAYDALRRRYPALGARIERRRDGFDFVEPAELLPEMVVSDGPAEAVFDEVDLGQCQALSQLWVRRDGADEWVITLFSHHSVTDSATGQDRVAQLWAYYTTASEGALDTVEPLPFPSPVEEILAARGIQRPAWADQVPATATVRTDGVDGRARVVRQPERLRLTSELTTALIDFSRREQVSLNGLISGALLLAEAQLRDASLASLLYMFPVDLRARLDPKVSIYEGTVVLGFVAHAPAGEGAATIADLGRAINEQVREGLDSGVVQQSSLLIPDGSEGGVVPQIPRLVTASNWGRLPQLLTPAGLDIHDFHSMLASAPVADSPQDLPPNYIISSFGDRLSIEVDHHGGLVASQQDRMGILETILRQSVSAL